MADKPYTERLGGSYTLDPKTGKAERVAFTKPASAAGTATNSQPAAKAAPASPDKKEH